MVEFCRDLIEVFSENTQAILRDFTGMTDEDILKLQCKGPEMLTALLEGSDIANEAEKIGRDIDPSAIKKRMLWL